MSSGSVEARSIDKGRPRSSTRPEQACLQHGQRPPRYLTRSRRFIDHFVFANLRAEIYNNDRFTKSHVYTLLLRAKTNPHVFNCIDKTLHREKRRVVSKAITDQAIRAFEPTMASQIDIFLQQLLASIPHREPVNMTQRCKRLGFDIVGLLGFGYELSVQTQSQYHFMLKGLVAGNYKSNAFMQFPLLKQLGLDAVLHGLGSSSRNRFLGVLDQMASTRLAQGRNARKDLVSFVAEGSEGSSLDDIQLRELLYSEGLCKPLFLAAPRNISCAFSFRSVSGFVQFRVVK